MGQNVKNKNRNDNSANMYGTYLSSMNCKAVRKKVSSELKAVGTKQNKV